MLRPKELTAMPPCLLLTNDEILHVLASTCICYAAFADDDGPYLLPLAFTVTNTAQILLHLRPGGRACRMLTNRPQLCLAFSLMDDSYVDSVLISGTADVGLADDRGCLPVRVSIREASGRRYPISRLG